MRKAFSMITAIFIILLLATVAAFILNISGKALQTTTLQYQREQAVLYARSYTELAILAATANDSTNTNCVEDLDGLIGDDVTDGEGFDIQTRIYYIGDNLQCSGTRELNDQTVLLNTPDSLHIIVDVYVRYRDLTFVDLAGGVGTSAPWITYHRRTLQKL